MLGHCLQHFARFTARFMCIRLLCARFTCHGSLLVRVMPEGRVRVTEEAVNLQPQVETTSISATCDKTHTKKDS